MIINLASVNEYVNAFNEIKSDFTDGHQSMLSANYHATNHTSTTKNLAIAAGYKSYRGVNLQYGILGRKLAESRNWSSPQHSDGSTFIPSEFLVKWDKRNDGWYCILHQQVVEALEITGLTGG